MRCTKRTAAAEKSLGGANNGTMTPAWIAAERPPSPEIKRKKGNQPTKGSARRGIVTQEFLGFLGLARGATTPW